MRRIPRTQPLGNVEHKLVNITTSPSTRLVYFDTSAVNYFAGRLSIGDAVVTKAFQEARGRRWLISPVTIFEILNTSDDVRRERLIFFAQHLFHEELLPSPEELLISFLNEGCPARQSKRPLRSTAEMARVWKNLCGEKRKTFVIDRQLLRNKFQGIASITRNIHKLSRHRNISVDLNDEVVRLDTMLSLLVRQLPWMKEKRWVGRDHEAIYKIAIYYLMIFICGEAGVHPEPLREFWRRAGLRPGFERVLYLLKEHPNLLLRGPLILMAVTTYEQTKAQFSRGTYWDSLHATYITYVDWFLTEDRRLVELRKALHGHAHRHRLHAPSEMLLNLYGPDGQLVASHEPERKRKG